VLRMGRMITLYFWLVSASPESGSSIEFTSCDILYKLNVIGVWWCKVKLSRYMPWRHMGGKGGIARTHFNLGTRWGWVVSVTPQPRFTPGEKTPGTHWIGGWVGPRTSLDAGARRKILCPWRRSSLDHLIVQPILRRYTAWATAAPV
jgi:hypothetical protein